MVHCAAFVKSFQELPTMDGIVLGSEFGLFVSFNWSAWDFFEVAGGDEV